MQRWLEVRQCWFQHVLLQFDYLRLVLVGVLFRVLLAAAKVLAAAKYLCLTCWSEM